MFDGVALHLTRRAPYRPVWALQQALVERRLALRVPDVLITAEHEEVITLGRNARREHVRLPASGAPEVISIERGGDVTYHGPGQITAYLICDLRQHDLGVKRFVWALEEAVIRTIARFGIAAERREGLIGVWVPRWAKIAAAGVRITRGVSFHGIALNVGDCLRGFDWMVPCGLEGEAVTTMSKELGSEIDLAIVADALSEEMGAVFGVAFRSLRAGAPRSEEEAGELRARIEREAVRGARRPEWLRMKLPAGRRLGEVSRVLREGSLSTVCQEARCPNRAECWNSGTATFLVMGPRCTRGCRFCAVEQGPVNPPDPEEPRRVAEAAASLGLKHVVVTSTTRDDVADGGAAHFVATIREIRATMPGATVEVLIPDFGGSESALQKVLDARPEVLNHNVETVPRLYAAARPGADYRRSHEILRRAAAAGLSAKSGFMVGLGESAGEIRRLLGDLRDAGCERVTIGQYLQPTRTSLPVKRYWTVEEFEAWGRRAKELGFRHVSAGPLVRSSYHAQV